MRPSRPVGDPQPMLAAIARTAARLCDGNDAVIRLVEGDQTRLVARYGRLGTLGKLGETSPLTLDMVPHRAIVERRTIHIRDLAKTPRTRFLASKARLVPLGVRTILATPLLRDGAAIGTIVIRRTKVRPFTPKQIALLKTFADQAAIAIENAHLSQALEARNTDLNEALEQQTATSDILRVISISPTDAQPVFEIIVGNAVRVCGATACTVFVFDGEMVNVAATDIENPEWAAHMRSLYPAPINADLPSTLAIRERRVIHLPDLEHHPNVVPATVRVSKAGGYRTVLFMPMLRGGDALGAVGVARADGAPFSDRQIALLQTFTDQAVIAIENVRLFKELEARNRELTIALEQQTATAEILRVISRSPTDVQPVFDAIVESAVRLCDAQHGAVFTFDGDLVHLVAHHNLSEAGLERLRKLYPMRPTRAHISGRAILSGSVVQIPDTALDPEYGTPLAAARLGFQSLLAVPLLRGGAPIGSIVIYGPEPGPFPDEHISLLETFADQAVIAIENVRLFTELQERNREVTEALKQQTATSEILRVISSSPTDVQPVFAAVAASAARLCDAFDATILRVDAEVLRLVAHEGPIPIGFIGKFTVPLASGWLVGRAVLDQRMVQVADMQAEVDEYPDGSDSARRLGHRTMLGVPLLRAGEAIGVILLRRTEVRPFTDRQVELLKTFADQAVIAVENVRLFKELQARTGELTQSVERLTALGEVSQALSSTLDVETVLNTIVSHASQLAGAAGCSIYEYDEAAEQFELRATHNYDAGFVAALRAAPLRKGEGLMGRATEMREPVQIADITQPGAYQSSLRDALIRFGYRALLSVPLLREEQIIGSLSLTRKAPGEYSSEVIEVLKTFATQSALAIQNARLFREIADKSRQLEVASRHKSEFLANMSHELRTPLNAIIGFSEVLNERMFGELNEKQDEYLRDIHASGTHLLSLINDILDLSKVEAGRMELELTDFDLPAAMDNAVTLVRERASRKGVTVRIVVGDQVGAIRGDERKIRQVLLNLLSNAIKFTPEGGRIEVGAMLEDGAVEVSVSDTGVGIAPEDQEAVFEEFRQVGASAAKQEGTGLGLALCRKFIELHGGTILVTSAIGAGSTFTFRLPQ